jgi:hypothetical protein
MRAVDDHQTCGMNIGLRGEKQSKSAVQPLLDAGRFGDLGAGDAVSLLVQRQSDKLELRPPVQRGSGGKSRSKHRLGRFLRLVSKRIQRSENCLRKQRYQCRRRRLEKKNLRSAKAWSGAFIERQAHFLAAGPPIRKAAYPSVHRLPTRQTLVQNVLPNSTTTILLPSDRYLGRRRTRLR